MVLDAAAAAMVRLRAQVAGGQVRMTQYAQQEMFAEAFTLDDVMAAIGSS
jgi:hypothetical protein